MIRTADAALAAVLLALDPDGLRGAVLKGHGGPSQEAWIAGFRNLLRERMIRRVPPHVGSDRLLGGIDIAATLKAGAPRRDRGLLAEADGGVLLLTSAERLEASKAALIAAAMDTGEPGRFAVILCDEGREDDEKAPVILTERIAFPIMIDGCDAIDVSDIAVDEARALLPKVTVPHEVADGLCRTALALGIPSARPALFALKAARALAALDGRTEASPEDAATAARLILAPRALSFPAAPGEQQPPEQDPPPPSSGEQQNDDEQQAPSPQDMAELLLAAVKAHLPEGLLAQLERGMAASQRGKSGNGAAAAKTGVKRGRPAGTRPGDPRDGARLSLIDTIRTAAPWQKLRRLQTPDRGGVLIRREDFRIRRFKENKETTAIFVVDASGSAALHRMAEAKGAIELLLADCYVRRDQAALIAFKGKTADLLLPPTRSLQRAKRALADLPGGGGTPLCAAIEQALAVSLQVKRAGGIPLVVFLTDGRANIARNGEPGRGPAMADAEQAAGLLRVNAIRTLMIDLSDRARGEAAKLAGLMGAAYLPLPHAGSATINAAVSQAMAQAK